MTTMNSPDHESNSLRSAELWAVWRIDDNGNVFVVREHLDRAEAEKLVEKFTACGHKQMYWVERDA
ncbi:MAG: hypothetical protein K8U57_34645 [Planctomycetes bacterium]|nr:hypothetical protein [Planctomycetota bacterium]